ncbi:MAG: hypothetical protein AAGI51_05800 [Pseudomonadota bacterium]
MHRLLTLFAVLGLLTFAPAQASQTSPNGSLFLNLTTDDTWSAAKAIHFAHERVLASGRPVAIWMNVRAVYLAERGRPSHVPGLMREADRSIHDMLRDFMAAGGRVIMCRACSAAAGLELDDYIEGVEMGAWPEVEALLFAPGAQTLAW